MCPKKFGPKKRRKKEEKNDQKKNDQKKRKKYSNTIFYFLLLFLQFQMVKFFNYIPHQNKINVYFVTYRE